MPGEMLRGKTALVTGASSGLGMEFARLLAERGCHLILVARREEALARLKQELEGRQGVRVFSIPMDLAAADAPRQLYDQVQAAGLQVDVLVNNAGLGLFGGFAEIPWEREKGMLDLDMLAVVHLTKLFAPDMVGRKFGYVLNIGSTGSFQPTPTYASYAAAKSFVLSYSEAVNYELRGTGVHCTALCPGITRTEFLQVSGQKITLYQRLTMMESARVVRVGLNAMLRGRSSVVAGWLNAFVAGLLAFIPRQWAAGLASLAMRL
jgi:uncharacterized protein